MGFLLPFLNIIKVGGLDELLWYLQHDGFAVLLDFQRRNKKGEEDPLLSSFGPYYSFFK